MSVDSHISGIIAPFLFKKPPMTDVSIVISSDWTEYPLIIQKRKDESYVVKVKRVKDDDEIADGGSGWLNRKLCPYEDEGWLDYDDDYEKVTCKKCIVELKNFERVMAFIHYMWILKDILTEARDYTDFQINIAVLKGHKLVYVRGDDYEIADFNCEKPEDGDFMGRVTTTFSMFNILKED